MAKISDHEKEAIIEELAEEFPGDTMMQELHLIRHVHQHETEGLNIEEKIDYFRRKAAQMSAGPIPDNVQ